MSNIKWGQRGLRHTARTRSVDIPIELRKEIGKLWKDVWSGVDGAMSRAVFRSIICHKITQDRQMGVPEAEIALFVQDALRAIKEKRFLVFLDQTELDRETLSIRKK